MTEEENSYQPSKGEDNPYCLYLIVKSSLNMSLGKTVAQCGHAVGMIYDRYLRLAMKNCTQTVMGNELFQMEAFEAWDSHGNRKVVLSANDSQFERIKQELGEQVHVVRDAGLTEISAGEETVISLWPAQKQSFPKIIKRLQCCK